MTNQTYKKPFPVDPHLQMIEPGLFSFRNGTVEDVNGNIYRTIILNDQEWMLEDLKVTHYRNGDEIPFGGLIEYNGEYKSLKDTGNGEYYCYSENNGVNIYFDMNILFYNWYAVNDPRNIAPKGWRIPSEKDWKKVSDLITEKGLLVSKTLELFHYGIKHDTVCQYPVVNFYGNWWSVTQNLNNDACAFYTDSEHLNQIYYYFLNKTAGCHVRCVRQMI